MEDATNGRVYSPEPPSEPVTVWVRQARWMEKHPGASDWTVNKVLVFFDSVGLDDSPPIKGVHIESRGFPYEKMKW